MGNQEIREAVERICEAVCEYVDVDERAAFRDAAQRLYPLSIPREITVRGERYRMKMEKGELQHLDVNYPNGGLWLRAGATAAALEAYDQLKALGFTVEE